MHSPTPTRPHKRQRTQMPTHTNTNTNSQSSIVSFPSEIHCYDTAAMERHRQEDNFLGVNMSISSLSVEAPPLLLSGTFASLPIEIITKIVREWIGPLRVVTTETGRSDDHHWAPRYAGMHIREPKWHEWMPYDENTKLSLASLVLRKAGLDQLLPRMLELEWRNEPKTFTHASEVAATLAAFRIKTIVLTREPGFEISTGFSTPLTMRFDAVPEDMKPSIWPEVSRSALKQPMGSHGLDKIRIDFDIIELAIFFGFPLPHFNPIDQVQFREALGAARWLQGSGIKELTIDFSNNYGKILDPWSFSEGYVEHTTDLPNGTQARFLPCPSRCLFGHLVDYILDHAWNLGYLQNIDTIILDGPIQPDVRAKWENISNDHHPGPFPLYFNFFPNFGPRPNCKCQTKCPTLLDKSKLGTRPPRYPWERYSDAEARKEAQRIAVLVARCRELGLTTWGW